jgi:hypothetical protein
MECCVWEAVNTPYMPTLTATLSKLYTITALSVSTS